MEIKLHEIEGTQWYLTADSKQFILAIERTRKNKETGEPEKYLLSEMFFKELDMLIKEYALMKVRISDIKNFHEFAIEMNKMNKWIEEIHTIVNPIIRGE